VQGATCDSNEGANDHGLCPNGIATHRQDGPLY
jgi:hypothetical protein